MFFFDYRLLFKLHMIQLIFNFCIEKRVFYDYLLCLNHLTEHSYVSTENNPIFMRHISYKNMF